MKDDGDYVSAAIQILLGLLGFLIYLGAVYPHGLPEQPARTAPQTYP